MEQIDIEEVRAWAVAAGEIARRSFNNVVGRRKADRSLVTAADEEIERVLVGQIRARYPHHGIIGEEQARQAGDGEYLWAIDPLDGTAAFLAGLPIWGVSIGLLRNEQPYLGVLYLPLLDDCYWADPAGGARYNGLPIHVIDDPTWDSESWLAVPSNIHRRFHLSFPGKVRSTGSTAAGIAYVARGSATAALVGLCSIWDIAAVMAILRGAGGDAWYLDGRPLDIKAYLDGRSIREPAIFASPAQARSLLPVISYRQPEGKTSASGAPRDG